MITTPRCFLVQRRQTVLISGFLGLFFCCAEPAVAWDPLTRSVLVAVNQATPSIPKQAKEVDAKVSWSLLPTQVNLRPEMEALRVNFIQQGARNTCGLFSASTALELRLRRLGVDLDISEQFMVWAATKEGIDVSDGLAMRDLARVLGKHGFCREEFMPYQPNEAKTLIPPQHALDDAAAMPLAYARALTSNGARPGLDREDLLAICRVLARGSPVCFASFWADGEGKLTRDQILTDEGVSTRGTLGHMVVLTGYELQAGDPWDNGFFHFRNSWGVKWGDFGFAKMPFSYAKRFGFGAMELRFDHDRKTGQGADDGFEPPAEEPQAGALYTSAARALPQFALKLLGFSVGAFFVGLIPGLLLLAVQRKNLLGLLGSGFLFLALYSGVLGATWNLDVVQGEGASLKIGLLLLGLIFALAKISARMHGLSLLTSLLFVGLWFGSFNLGLRAIPLLLKSPEEELLLRWVLQPATASLHPQEIPNSEAGLALLLQRSLEDASEEDETATQWRGELEWLQRWSKDLDFERRFLVKNQKMDAPFFQARLVSLRETHERFKALKQNPQSTAQMVSTGVDERRHALERAYWDLEQERAKIDISDSEAVKAFNEKAAEFRRLREEFLQSDRQTPRPNNDGATQP